MDKRNHHRRQQGRAHIAEHQQQHHDHQDGAFEQVLLHGGDGLVDQDRAVVDRIGGDAFRQCLVDLRQLAGYRIRHGAAVFAEQHHRRAEHRLLAIAGGGTGAQLLAEGDLRDIAHRDGHAVAVRDDDALDGGNVLDLAR